jgi:hypothetical protein
MYYLIGADGKLHGPLTAADIHTWLAEGRASKYSRVRRATEDTWQALGSIPELLPLRREPASDDPNRRAPDDPRASLRDTVAAFVDNAPRLDAASCVSRAWRLVRANPVILVGSAVVAWSLIIGFSFMPRVGWIAGPLLNSPLLGGLYVVYLGRLRNRPTRPEDLFAGFRLAYVPLVLAGLFCGAVTTPGIIALMNPAIPRVFGLLIIPGVYLAVCYMFALPLIVDRRLDVWTALEVSRQVVRRQWWTALALALIAWLIVVAGVLALVIGVIITMPVAMATFIYAYEDLFGG